MSIIIRRNKKTARIMRQEYVRKASEGNPHGFVRQVPLATISLSATEVPDDIAKLLSPKELEHLERVVVQPAKAAAEQRMKEAEARERDPEWRMLTAIQYLEEAAERSQHVQVDRKLLARLHQTVALFGAVVGTKTDPLAAVTDAVKAAITAIEEGGYGRNDGPVRKDAFPAKAWAELRAVLLENEKCLQSVLQDAGWVVKRERATRQ